MPNAYAETQPSIAAGRRTVEMAVLLPSSNLAAAWFIRVLTQLCPTSKSKLRFSTENRISVVQMENMENEGAQSLVIMERPIGIEPTPEPWQVCKERSVNNLRGTVRSTK